MANMRSVSSAAVVCSMLVPATVAHMSMQFPYPRDTTSGGAAYAVWQQNEPMVSVHPEICHGLQVDSSVREGNTFAAGEEVVIDLYGSASHSGGHCSFWYSTDDVNFIKIIDIVDCTIATGEVKVKLPQSMDSACETKCTFAWTWSPTSSGACEVYMNCADISVSGVGGSLADGEEEVSLNFNTDILEATCVRVDETTHYTTLFGTLVTEYQDTIEAGDSASGDVDTDELDEDDNCYKEGTQTEGDIADDGRCNVDGYRCDTGMCCSSANYCGPTPVIDENGDTQYCDWDSDSDCQVYYDSEEEAFAAYCDNNNGDWRLTSDCDYEENQESLAYDVRAPSTIMMTVVFVCLLFAVLA